MPIRPPRLPGSGPISYAIESAFVYTRAVRPLRYSINVTLDGGCDLREGLPDEERHRHAQQNLEQADALLFGRVTYEMIEEAWRPAAQTGAAPDWMQPWMEPLARATDSLAGRGKTKLLFSSAPEYQRAGDRKQKQCGLQYKLPPFPPT